MDSLQPLTRKVDHIEWLPYHPDKQDEIFDVIVNDMKIFEWVDENGETCEYMYILNDQKELYKMKMISEKTYRDMIGEATEYNTTTPTWLIKKFRFLISGFIETIPFLAASRFGYPLSDIYKKIFGNYYIFKCRKWRFTAIFSTLAGRNLQNLLPENGNILVDIDNYLLFHKNKIVDSGFEYNSDSAQYEENGRWRITSEDIEKGNEILRKVIAYLEETYPEHTS